MSVRGTVRNRTISVKAFAGRAADSALDRLQELVAAPGPSSSRRIRLTCVFLQWDPERASAALDALSERLHSWPELEVTIILVDNRTPEAPIARNSNASFVIAGDNRAWEFSGLQAGIDMARTKRIQTDVWLLVNDRYQADNHPFLPHLTSSTVRAAIELRGIVGHIDAYPRTVSSYGFQIRRWITTSFVLASDQVLQRCCPLISVTRDEINSLIDDSEATMFRPGGPVGPDHAAYLQAWLTGAGGTDLKTRWYGAADLRTLDPAVRRRKVQSILNEQLLSARATHQGIPLVPIDVAHALGQFDPGGTSIARVLHQIREHPESHPLLMRSRAARFKLVGSLGLRRVFRRTRNLDRSGLAREPNGRRQTEEALTVREICAVIVTYNPDPAFPARLKRIQQQVDAVVIIDNASTADLRSLLASQSLRKSIFVRLNGENLGVATALNQGIEEAASRGYRWFVLFDQDSDPTPTMVTSLAKVWETYPDRARLSVLGSNHTRSANEPSPQPEPTMSQAWLECTTVITSGSLLPLTAYQAVGPFREDFFIDEVDHEWCLRARSRGYRVAMTRTPVLYHAVGTPAARRFFWRTATPSNHPPLRWYYMSRNSVMLLRMYWRSEPGWVLINCYNRLVFAIKAMIYESEKRRKARYMIQGLVDGMAGRLGRL